MSGGGVAYEDDNRSGQAALKKRVTAALKNMQMEQQKKEVMKQLLETKAYERLMNIRISSPELYKQMVNLIISLAQTNRIQGKMSEQQLISILDRVTFRKETTINFKHK